ncbi:unnamed protein product [Mytilus edulis]|uniref:PHD-type domain-containing protein n=1 Tax=Mytilus edulis TaxID=6550 RepID=A0A8S3QRI4_MYTED|nr:unnamed protein product [Mytilus edulis]
MAAGQDGLTLALVLFGIFIRLTPTSDYKIGFKHELPENLGYYSCSNITNLGKYNFAIEKLFPTVRVNSTTQYGRPTTTTTIKRKVQNPSQYFLILSILLSGDIHHNPGPIKHPCTDCNKPVKCNQKAIQCDFCDLWTHLKCTNLSVQEYNILSKSDDNYYCECCTNRLPNFTDSYFKVSTSCNTSISSECGSINVNNISNVNIEDVEQNIFDELKGVRIKHPNNFHCAYLNINSFRNKFSSIKDLLNDNLVDMIIVAETKLDETFKNGEFFIDNYHLWRADRTAKGGGLLVYIRSDLACDRKTKLECKTIESIFTEINFKDRKWLICGLYRPPSLNDNLFIEDFNKTFDKISEKYDNVIIIGDLNYNCLDAEKCIPLINMCDVFDFTNIVKKATCFTKNALPTLLDVILTNKPNFCQNISNFNCGLSDYHNIISFQLKGFVPKIKKEFINYRSFKSFDQEKFVHELNCVNFDNLLSVDDVNEAYSNFQSEFVNIIDRNHPNMFPVQNEICLNEKIVSVNALLIK